MINFFPSLQKQNIFFLFIELCVISMVITHGVTYVLSNKNKSNTQVIWSYESYRMKRKLWNSIRFWIYKILEILKKIKSKIKCKNKKLVDATKKKFVETFSESFIDDQKSFLFVFLFVFFICAWFEFSIHQNIRIFDVNDKWTIQELPVSRSSSHTHELLWKKGLKTPDKLPHHNDGWSSSSSTSTLQKDY